MVNRPAAMIALAVVSACGIDAVGTMDPGAFHAPDRTPDARPDGGGTIPTVEDADVPQTCAGTCMPGATTAPFAHVLFGDRGAACPGGFDASDVVENPMPGAGSCACGACAFSGTTCTSGALVSKYSSDTTCNGTGSNLQGNGGNCFAFNGQFISTYAAMLPPTAVPGTCSAAGVAVRANVATKDARVCSPRPGACLDALCAAPPALAVCVAADGDVPCPTSAPNRHLVGSDVALTCAACTCTTQATCTGTVTFYSGADCTGTPRVLTAGVCTVVNQASFQSTRWAGTVAAQSCTNVTPAAAASASLTGVRTVCCP